MFPRDNNQSPQTLLVAFWLMGLLNNSPFVVMLAGAKLISEGGTALVFLANTGPDLLVKSTAPLWFDRVGYRRRMMGSSLLFVASFTTVAWFALGDGGAAAARWQLFGVALGSMGCSVGEASLLALGGRFESTHKGATITAFSSGTGLAGIFGFGWKFLWSDVFGLSFTVMLLIANIIPLGYCLIYSWLLDYVDAAGVRAKDQNVEMKNFLDDTAEGRDHIAVESSTVERRIEKETGKLSVDTHKNSLSTKVARGATKTLTFSDRMFFLASLWPYMAPLFVVYFGEYAQMSGPWTAIGFPVDDSESRNRFYECSNWMYQVGVFISRSSGTLFRAPLCALWIMPMMQLANLVFFCWTATNHYWYDWSLLALCFVAGLLGGAVYVNAFTRISSDFQGQRREFALASATVANSVGIVLADVCGLFIQSCLYAQHGINGSAVSCPL